MALRTVILLPASKIARFLLFAYFKIIAESSLRLAVSSQPGRCFRAYRYKISIVSLASRS